MEQETEKIPFDFLINCEIDKKQQKKLKKALSKPKEKINEVNLFLKTVTSDYGSCIFEITFNPWEAGMYHKFVSISQIEDTLGADFVEEKRKKLEEKRVKLLAL